MLFLKKNAPRILVGGMFLLLAAQLIWWLTFFRLKQKRFEQLEEALDEQRIALMRASRGSFPDIVCNDGKCAVRPEILAERARRHAREMWMLLSETMFVLSVIGYGSWLVFRSVQKEKQLARERITFLNSIAHELKTPIAGTQLALQTLQKRSLSPKQRSDLLNAGIENIRRLSSQVENVLLSGEMENASLEMLSQSCDCVQVLHTYVARLPEKDSIHVESPHSLKVSLPQHLLERLYDILIQNALVHARGAVTVSVRSELSEVKITVADNGPGIPESELENIFKPFYRLSEARGTGLGLYLARQIVTIGHGTLTARNNIPRGALLEVRLPPG